MTLLVDGAHGGQENKEQARKKNIELVTSTLSGKKPKSENDEVFVLDETGQRVVTCPADVATTANTYNAKQDQVRAKFDLETCKQCPLLDTCRVKLQKNLRLSPSPGRPLKMQKIESGWEKKSTRN